MIPSPYSSIIRIQTLTVFLTAPHQIQSIPKLYPFSQLLRHRKLYSKDPAFREKAKEMSTFFVNNGYSSEIINDALQKVIKIPQTRSTEE